MLYEMFRMEGGQWIKCGKSTNAFYATKRCIENSWKLTEYETGRILVQGYEPPDLTPHEDRSVNQLRKDAGWVSKQLFVHA